MSLNLVTFDFEISFSALPSYTCKDTYCDKRLFYCCLCILNLHSTYYYVIMASKYHDDWQSSKKTVLQRNAYMFDNELMGDVSFICGKSHIQGINVEENKTARRRILGDSVYEIRFLEMSQENIVKYVSPTGILTNTEIVCILQKINGLDVAELKWRESGKRQRANFASFRRFDSGMVKKSHDAWVHKGRSDALTLTVNKAVLFHGVRLFGDTLRSQYNVNLKIKDENVTGTYTSQQDSDGVPGYDVMLPKPIPLLSNEEITIIATIKGPNSYFGEQGKSLVKVDDVFVTFKGAPSGLSNNHTQAEHEVNFTKFFCLNYRYNVGIYQSLLNVILCLYMLIPYIFFDIVQPFHSRK